MVQYTDGTKIDVNIIRNTPEYKFWIQYGDHIHRFIYLDKNVCRKNDSCEMFHQRQNPKDVIDSSAECMEYHYIWTNVSGFCNKNFSSDLTKLVAVTLDFHLCMSF